MKLKKIETVCKNGACIRINRSPDGKLWIGDEAAVYFVGGLNDISKEQLFTIFDIPEEKRESYSVVEDEVLYDDNDFAERIINRRLKTVLCIGGRALAIYEVDGKPVCINTKYLTPFDDEKDVTLYIRNNGGRIIVKKGLFVIAVISAFDLELLEELKNDIRFISEAFRLLR